jgi:glycerophosphoryl diester phosphodiesterase
MKDHILIVGHRGARGLYPENTRGGFARAIALGLGAIELDVAVTADRVVVVSHDPRLNPDITRGRDGAWLEPPTPLICSLSFEELRGYDVGRLRPESAYAAKFPQQQPEDGARIPSLREVLALDPKVEVFIELKTFPAQPELTLMPAEMADLVIEAANTAGAAARITVLSFDWRGLRHVQRQHPTISTGWLTLQMSAGERKLWWGDPAFRLPPARAVAAQGGTCWLPRFSELRDGDIAAAQALGLSVIPWDVEGLDQIARAIEWHADGLITDRPDLAMRFLRA